MDSRPVALLVVALFAVGVAAGAPTLQTDEPTVDATVTAETTQLADGSTTTVRVVVDGASAGVGSTELSLSVTDPTVAGITAVTFVGNTTVEETSIVENGSTATASGVGLDQSAASVTVLEATVEARGTGTTALNLSVDGVADTEGRPYEVTANDASVTLTVGDGAAGDGNSGQLPGSLLAVVVLVFVALAIGVYRSRSE